MIRIEYTIDGKTWIHVTHDFSSLVYANKYLDENQIREMAYKIKLLTITSELEIDGKFKP